MIWKSDAVGPSRSQGSDSDSIGDQSLPADANGCVWVKRFQRDLVVNKTGYFSLILIDQDIKDTTRRAADANTTQQSAPAKWRNVYLAKRDRSGGGLAGRRY